jgi:hypothetical protein
LPAFANGRLLVSDGFAILGFPGLFGERAALSGKATAAAAEDETMKATSAREVLARPGPIHPVNRNQKGTREAASLSPQPDCRALNSAAAILLLARSGPSLMEAKRTIEAAMDEGEAKILLTTVDDRQRLSSDLGRAGFCVQFEPS